MTKDRLRQAVMDELSSNPRIDDRQIAVSVNDHDEVKLQGTVGSLRERIEAERTSHAVRGVRQVRNELEVHILTSDLRQDAEIRGQVLQALRLNSLVPETIGVTVEEGIVTLTGSAKAAYQRDEAEDVAVSVRGVRGIRSEIAFESNPDVSDIKLAIRGAIQRDAEFDAEGVYVTYENGVVTLSGHVSSWPAHDTVVTAARTANNVTKVVDHVAVEY